MKIYENESALVDRIVERIYTEYDGISNITSHKRLYGGERNDVFALFTPEPLYVVRIIHHSTDVRGVRYTNAWSRFASKYVPLANAPFLTKQGDTLFIFEGMIISIYPFVNGIHSDREDSLIRDEIARIQADLHNAGLKFPNKAPRPDRERMIFMDLDNNFLYNWDNVDRMLKSGGNAMFGDKKHQNETDQNFIRGIYDRRELLYEAKAEFSTMCKELLRNFDTLLCAPIHGDMYSSNVLAENHRITGIIDWDECNNDILAYELARTCWEYCKDAEKITFDINRAERYLEIYRKNGGPVPRSQYKYMVPLLRMLKFLDIMLYLNNSIIGDVWGPEYGFESIIALENLKKVSFEY